MENAQHLVGEVTGIYDVYRLITGTDPVTGEEVNRFEAGVWVFVDAFGKIVSIRKVFKSIKAADTVKDVSKVASAVDKVDDAADLAKSTNPLESITYTEKVEDQMKLKDFHGFPESVEAFGSNGKITELVGGDGVIRKKVIIHGSYKGRKGFFEFIIEPDNSVNHRMFREILDDAK